MKIQPRNKRWTKVQRYSGLDERLERAVERDSIRWGCSKSWIVACALAAFYDIDIIRPVDVIKRGKIRKVA